MARRVARATRDEGAVGEPSGGARNEAGEEVVRREGVGRAGGAYLEAAGIITPLRRESLP